MQTARHLYGTWFGAKLAVVGLLLLGAAGCGDTADAESATRGTAAVTGTATHDVAMQETPCVVMPNTTLGKVFDLPADEIEQKPIHFMDVALCNAEWEGEARELDVEMRLRVFDTVEQAARHFQSSTRSVTKEEMQAAMEAFKKMKG